MGWGMGLVTVRHSVTDWLKETARETGMVTH